MNDIHNCITGNFEGMLSVIIAPVTAYCLNVYLSRLIRNLLFVYAKTKAQMVPVLPKFEASSHPKYRRSHNAANL